MQFDGYYINLDTSVDRDARMRQQLAALRIAGTYRRFEAIRGAGTPQRSQTTLTDGHLGCWLSHQAVWMQGIRAGRHLHVLEDDAILSPLLVQMLEKPNLDEDGWDLLFTDVYFHPPPSPVQFTQLMNWMQAFARGKGVVLADLKDLPFTGTTSYLVNHRGMEKLLALTDGQWTLNRSFDVHLQELVRQGKVRARVTVPFVSTIGPENLATTTGSQGPALAALNAFREALYYRADPSAIYARIRPCECRTETATAPLLGIYLELLRNVLGTLDTAPDQAGETQG